MKSGSLRRSIVFGPLVFFTPRQKTSTRNPHAKTVLPVSRATRTPTRPDSPDSDSGDDVPGQSACPVTPSLSDQCSVTQQPATGASRLGTCAAIVLMMGITSAGFSPSARAILLRRAALSPKFRHPFRQFAAQRRLP